MEEEMKDWMPSCSIDRKMVDSVDVGIHYDVSAPKVTDEEIRAYIHRGCLREPGKTLTGILIVVGRAGFVRLDYRYNEKSWEFISRIQPKEVQSDEANEFHCPSCGAPIDEIEMREVVTLKVQPDGTFWTDEHEHYLSNFHCPKCDAQLATESTGYGEEFKIVDADHGLD